jgi:putative transposase
MATCREIAAEVGARAACEAMAIARATYYRHLGKKPDRPKLPRPSPPRALSQAERQNVLDIQHSGRFMDKAPAEVFATLLDEGEYCCSIRTMYRLLIENKEVRERRRQAKHPAYKKPELLAVAPNQLWPWDITKLRGPVKRSYFHLYAIMDVYSRYVVGWMVAEGESAALAKKLIGETLRKQGIKPGQLAIHADRGSLMKMNMTTPRSPIAGVMLENH